MTDIYKWSKKEDGGEFKRQVSSFRNWITKDGEFKPEAGRYHLYVSLACPWAHRTLILRSLKGLEDSIGVSVVDYLMGPEGWHFSEPSETPGCIPDTINHAKLLREIYFKADPNYNARFTVPVLWDKKKATIVSNESSEIIRMLNSEFNQFATRNKDQDYYPEALKEEIDGLNEWIYPMINNGVYKSGFATTQKAYEAAVVQVFKGLDRVEEILSRQPWLSSQFSEADIRLWTTIVRFDPVYVGHFKCNLKTIRCDYPNSLKWARRIYQMPGIAETVNMEHIKKHYYMSHIQINPTQVVPISNGPDLNLPVD